MRGAFRVSATAGVLLAAFLAGRVQGQTDYEEKVMEGSEGDEASAAAAWERLDGWRNHPLDLNRAGSDELRLLPLFSPALAEAAVRERSAACKAAVRTCPNPGEVISSR